MKNSSLFKELSAFSRIVRSAHAKATACALAAAVLVVFATLALGPARAAPPLDPDIQRLQAKGAKIVTSAQLQSMIAAANAPGVKPGNPSPSAKYVCNANACICHGTQDCLNMANSSAACPLGAQAFSCGPMEGGVVTCICERR